MLALLIVETVIVVGLVVLVAGLLRSHADILRALHRLGAGVGDPTIPGSDQGHSRLGGHGHNGITSPITLGPPLPGERSSSAVHDVAGNAPDGAAVSVAVTGVEHTTLLAFLSSGCSSCAGIWQALQDPHGAGLPDDVRVVAVTKGAELEIPAEVRRRAGAVTTVMSSQAWDDYEVPGSPFFVLVDGQEGRRIGEGVANRLEQVADLVQRALGDVGAGNRTLRLGWPQPAFLVDRLRRQATRGDQRPGADRRRDPARRSFSLPAPPHRHLRAASLGQLMGVLTAHGISVRLPAGFEARIFQREDAVVDGALEVSRPIAQFATFPIPPTTADFGGGAVTLMGPDDIFAVLFEYGPESLGRRLFTRSGMPRELQAGDFRPYTLKRGIGGHVGTQWFFTESNRPFTLYAVLGSIARRPVLVARLNQLLQNLAIQPTA